MSDTTTNDTNDAAALVDEDAAVVGGADLISTVEEERTYRGPEALSDAPMLSDFLKEEGNKNLTREVGKFKAGTDYKIGMLLAKDGDGVKEANASSTAIGAVIYAVDATDGEQVATYLRRGPAGIAEAAIIYADDVDTEAKKLAKRDQLADAGLVVLKSA